MSLPFQLRRANPEDAAELTQLIYLSKKSNGYDDAFMQACAEELRVTEDDIAASLIWVAEADRLLGSVTLVPHTATLIGEISSFFVHPQAKRQGVGRALWQLVLDAARDAGLTHLRLDADPEAVLFYKAMGFAVIGETPSGSIAGRFLPLMERTVPAQ